MTNIKITPKGLRVSYGYSQQEVAKVLGLSLTQYKRKENGHVRFYADEIFQLANFYDVPVQVFFIQKVS